MPVREPKGRVLVREYMADREFMKSFDAAEREAYLLLALFTDDAGWMLWDVEELAAAMYRFEDIEQRESSLAAYAQHFTEAGRLRILKCGHAHMPKVGNRPRGMTREYAVRDAHQARCGSSRRAVRQQSDSSLPPVKSIPNRSIDSTNTNGKSNQPRGRARGGAPRTLKEIVGWEPPKN